MDWVGQERLGKVKFNESGRLPKMRDIPSKDATLTQMVEFACRFHGYLYERKRDAGEISFESPLHEKVCELRRDLFHLYRADAHGGGGEEGGPIAVKMRAKIAELRETLSLVASVRQRKPRLTFCHAQKTGMILSNVNKKKPLTAHRHSRQVQTP